MKIGANWSAARLLFYCSKWYNACISKTKSSQIKVSQRKWPTLRDNGLSAWVVGVQRYFLNTSTLVLLTPPISSSLLISFITSTILAIISQHTIQLEERVKEMLFSTQHPHHSPPPSAHLQHNKPAKTPYDKKPTTPSPRLQSIL